MDTRLFSEEAPLPLPLPLPKRLLLLLLELSAAAASSGGTLSWRFRMLQGTGIAVSMENRTAALCYFGEVTKCPYGSSQRAEVHCTSPNVQQHWCNSGQAKASAHMFHKRLPKPLSSRLSEAQRTRSGAIACSTTSLGAGAPRKLRLARALGRAAGDATVFRSA